MATPLDKFFPFDAGPGANVTEEQWREMARFYVGSGPLVGEDNELEVYGDDSGLLVKIKTGKCFMRGHYGEITTEKTVAAAAAHATLARIDLIVLRLDTVNNVIELDKVTGTPHASPEVPTVTQTATVWEVALAQVSVPALDTLIGAGQVTDRRTMITPPSSVATTVTTVVLTVGSGTYTTPAGCVAFLVEVLAAGGGGGGTSGAGSATAAAGGGGAGGYASKLITAPASSYAYTVGAKGAGGASGTNVGIAGADSTFGAGGGLITAKGGGGGTDMAQGTAAAAVLGGSGGAVSTGGDVNAAGGAAQPGLRFSGTLAVSGGGGASYFGGGARGLVAQADGTAATNPGTGGGGARSGAGSQAGGAGADGLIVVTEYYS